MSAASVGNVNWAAKNKTKN